MQIHTDGLVIGEQMIGESDRLVTLLTREKGVIRAFAPKAKTLKNSKVSATQLLCYAKFVLYQGKQKYIIQDARTETLFFALRQSLTNLSLAQYFCELASILAPEELPAGDFLRLVLNGLHFLSKEERPRLLLKGVVELRMLALAGYMPNLIACDWCAAYESDPMYFLPKSARLCCNDCLSHMQERAIALSPGVLMAMRHTIYAEFEKLFSFSMQEPGLRQFSAAVEEYLLCTVQRKIQTLDFYHQMASMEDQL